MEVKISDSVPDWLVNKLSELRIFKASFSKYGKAYTNFIEEQIDSKKQIFVPEISVTRNNTIMNRSVL